jgi:integrase
LTHGLKGLTYFSLSGLLAVAGLRISEARNLQTDDVDRKEGVLTVRGSKFGKSRLVPIHPTTRKVLSDYASRRDHILSKRPATFFVSGPWHSTRRWRDPAYVLPLVEADLVTRPF